MDKLRQHIIKNKLTTQQVALLDYVQWSVSPKYITKWGFLDIMYRLDALTVEHFFENRLHRIILTGRVFTISNREQFMHPICTVHCGKEIGYTLNKALDKYLRVRKRILCS